MTSSQPAPFRNQNGEEKITFTNGTVNIRGLLNATNSDNIHPIGNNYGSVEQVSLATRYCGKYGQWIVRGKYEN
jgi:hypothetical protein